MSNNDVNPNSASLVGSSSSCSSTSTAILPAPNTKSYSLRAKQQLKLAQLSEINPNNAACGLDSNEERPKDGVCGGIKDIKESEKENDSGIEKDDSVNTLLVRVAINDQNLQVTFLKLLLHTFRYGKH